MGVVPDTGGLVPAGRVAQEAVESGSPGETVRVGTAEVALATVLVSSEVSNPGTLGEIAGAGME